MGKIVVGSSNTDMILRCAHLPKPGETVLGNQFAMAGGGKGANQAVGAARLGADVTFVARLGRDWMGDQAIAKYRAEGIDCSYIVRDAQASSGVALIMVDAAGRTSSAWHRERMPRCSPSTSSEPSQSSDLPTFCFCSLRFHLRQWPRRLGWQTNGMSG